MASIQEGIIEEFCQRLEKAEGFTEERVSQIRDLFSGRKKLKPAEIIKCLSEQAESKLQ